MSVETKSNGQLRIRCDVDDCDRLFVPLRPFTAAAPLRQRAELYGWTFATFDGRDRCPNHNPQRLGDPP